MDKYFSVERDVENEIVIERSRFITNVKSVKTEDEARTFLECVRKKYSLATHNCFACVCEMGAIKRSSDDGEPSGTAGQPMLDAIVSACLANVAVVVTRFFGGIKLGAGGLVRAYSKSVSDALKKAGKIEFSLCSVMKLTVNYDKISKISFITSSADVKVLSSDYGEKIVIYFAVKASQEKAIVEKLNESLSGSVEIENSEQKFINLK